MVIRPKLLIIGYARGGKDTVGEWFVKHGYTFVSSSRFVGEKVVWPAMQKINYEDGPDSLFRHYHNFEDAFEDRNEHRAFWYDAIHNYNIPDRSRLGRDLFAVYDMYVGLRNWAELEALRLNKAFDLCIWVDASERIEPEPPSSCTVLSSQADVIVDNNGTLEDLYNTLTVLYNKWIAPIEFVSSYKISGPIGEAGWCTDSDNCKRCRGDLSVPHVGLSI